MSDLAVKPVSAQTTQQNEKKDNLSTTRMMTRYALAVPVVYDVASFAKNYIKKTGKKDDLLSASTKTIAKNAATEVKISKEAKEAAGEVLKQMEKGKPEWSIVKESLKHYAILAGVGAGIGFVMKKVMDKYPDNKIIKGINTTAKYVGFDFF